MQKRIDLLNEQQRQAVVYDGKTLLIVAGAGSGKTRVLTHRIAWVLYNAYCYPSQILAITFTNKAASEMKERISDMLTKETVYPMWVSTFHSSCVRILRKWHDRLGLSSSFTIYDADDSRRLIKNVLDEMGIDSKKYPPKSYAQTISNYKNELISPIRALELAEISCEIKDEISAKVYAKYQEKLSQLQALDFDDLIMRTIRLLENNSDIQRYYNNKFKYIFVDEYQDTNPAQYKLIRLLAGYDSDDLNNYASITVVGDSDQSIYAFRGATIRNINEFESDFSDAKVILLEQNYRSTNNILKAANAVIDKNPDRKKKNLWSDKGDGDLLIFKQLANGYCEAEYVVQEIIRLNRDENVKFKDIVVLYRTNSLSRSIEEELVSNGLGQYYKVVGGTKFYDRKEIRDVVAYLYAIINRHDDIHLRRILNVPARGIGKKSEEHVADFAAGHGFAFAEVFDILDDIDELATSAKTKILNFNAMLDEIYSFICNENPPLEDILKKVLDETEYLIPYKNSEDPSDQVRVDNIEELVSGASTFEPNQEFDDDGNEIDISQYTSLQMLEKYLEQIALTADSDQIPNDLEDQNGQITLMTLHTAKGLEYNTVFLVGFDDGYLPHSNSLNSEVEIEEERRLAYVGITRAKTRLYLTSSERRNIFGNWQDFSPSQFLRNIPHDLFE